MKNSKNNINSTLAIVCIIICNLICISCSCNNDGKKNMISTPEIKKEILSIDYSDSTTQILIDSVLKVGNVESYLKLKTEYLNYPFGALLRYAIVMSNEYDNTQAYWDVYFIFYQLNSRKFNYKIDDIYLKGLDDETRRFAISFLKIASKKGHKQAIKVYNKYVRK